MCCPYGAGFVRLDIAERAIALTKVTELRTFLEFFGVDIGRKSNRDGGGRVGPRSEDLPSCNWQKLWDAAGNSSEGVLVGFCGGANGEKMARSIPTGPLSHPIARPKVRGSVLSLISAS